MPSVTPTPADSAPRSSTEFASVVTAITSAFGDPTRRDIYLLARESVDGVTAAQLQDNDFIFV